VRGSARHSCRRSSKASIGGGFTSLGGPLYRLQRAEQKSARGPSKWSQVIGRYGSICLVTSSAATLPDDPSLLKAMLLAERAESERLRQIIRELQRHRFGRHAESLPEEQLKFALEEAEQIEAAGLAQTEGP
jgi:hypothetical protein